MKPSIKNQEDIVFAFKGLFEKYGYTPYKMNKFEEYDLYAKNKDYLLTNGIITFTDTNGKLMALKPDVTLSIVKNSKDGQNNKLYYNENVYRVSESTGVFKEIIQIGLENIGQIDDYTLVETLFLASKSLKILSDEYVLSISDLDTLSAVLETLKLSQTSKSRVLSAISKKNVGEIQSVCEEEGLSDSYKNALLGFVNVYGSVLEVKDKLEVFILDDKTEAVVNKFKNILTEIGGLSDAERVVVDFSVIDNMKYYNGLVFTGVINGVPSAVLSGGQYGKLMKRMNKKSGAIGFAIYLDQILKLFGEEKDLDADVVVLYDDNVSVSKVIKVVEEESKDGKTAIAFRSVPEKFRYGKIVKLTD